MKFSISLGLLAIAVLINGCSLSDKTERRVNDENFIMLENILSPNGNSRILIYQYDTGGFGYSRVFWAVTPNEFQNLNLAEFELPDGYRTENWTEENELQISRWQTYYYAKERIDIKTGNQFNGVEVKIVENCSKYPLGKEKCQ